MDATTTAPPSQHARELTQRVHADDLPGYGVRWDDRARVWRVRNELTGEWKLTTNGSVEGWVDFATADQAFHQHQPTILRFGW